MMPCNSAQCVKVWPSSTAMNPHYHHGLSLHAPPSSDIEGINSRLNTMSMEERAQGLDDLHGVASTPDETPEMLNTKLDEINTTLSRSGSSSSAPDSLPYRMALDMDSAYVERLKIPCLRATNYKSKEAAALMIRFFGQKLELFGKEKLVRDLRLSDLDRPGEMEAFREKGMFQVLPNRDRSGRVVLLNVGRVNQQYDIEVVLRVQLYFMMMACFQADEETQKKGVVCVYFAFGQTKVPLSRAMAFNKLAESLPVKIVAAHVCRYDDSNGNIFKSAIQYVAKSMAKRRLCRWRTHVVGTKMEAMYRLLTFGIIKETLPFTKNGEVDLTNHHRMLDLVQKREKEHLVKDEVENMKATGLDVQPKEEDGGDRSCNSDGDKKMMNFVSSPNPMDILMGRGRHPASSPGALALRRIVDSYFKKHDASTNFEKQVISDIVLKQLKELGCRFLKEAAGGYEEVDDAVARSKITHGFRNARLRSRQKQQKEKRTGGVKIDEERDFLSGKVFSPARQHRTH